MVLLLATFAHADEAAPLPNRPVDIAAVGGVLMNAFDRPALFGATLTAHANDVLAVELLGLAGTRFPDQQYKPSMAFIVDEDPALLADISQITSALGAGLRFTPIHGTIGDRRPVGLEISALLGTGLVVTRDDLEALDKADDPEALSTEVQAHPMLQVGACARIRFSSAVAWTLDARMFSFIEVVEADTLVTKQPVLLSTGVAWSPGRR